MEQNNYFQKLHMDQELLILCKVGVRGYSANACFSGWEEEWTVVMKIN